MAIESLLGGRSHDEGIYRLSATKPSRNSAMRTVTIVGPVLMRQLGERQGLPVECGTAQINEPLPARGMYRVFAIGDDSRHNRGRSHRIASVYLKVWSLTRIKAFARRTPVQQPLNTQAFCPNASRSFTDLAVLFAMEPQNLAPLGHSPFSIYVSLAGGRPRECGQQGNQK
jgi:hypothetical protein